MLTKHALERINERNIELSEVIDALVAKGATISDNGDGTATYSLGSLRVILDKVGGLVITVYRRCSHKKRVQRMRQHKARVERAKRRHQNWVERKY